MVGKPLQVLGVVGRASTQTGRFCKRKGHLSMCHRHLFILHDRERKKESDVILLKAKQGLAPIYFLPSGEVSVCGSREDREKRQQGLFLEFHFCGNFCLIIACVLGFLV